MSTDESKFIILCNNLLTNAYKFTERGGVHVEAWNSDENLFVSVTDTGKGIEKERLPHIFEKFTQTDSSSYTKKSIRGSGLGLYLCHLLIGLLGGTITAQSKQNTGSTFTFSLPTSMIHTFNNCLIYSQNKEFLGELVMAGHKIRFIDSIRGLFEEAQKIRPDGIIIDTDDHMLLRSEDIKTSGIQCQIFIRTDETLEINEKERKYIHFFPSHTPNTLFLQYIKEAHAPKGDTLFHNQTLLIIEDDVDIREMYKITFEGRGYKVFEADDGLTGIAKAAEIRPGVIILDIMMPHMDGFDVLSVLRNNSTMRPVIVVNSNLEGVYEEKRVKELGADYFLRKSEHTPLEVVNFVEKNIFMK